MSILQFLLPDTSDVHARDADGWTALHNACSKVGRVEFYALAHLTIPGLSRYCTLDV